eukprot:TRINITY_DN61449_c0_g1_i1.p2 TRINITY_DN61449_c0_g1~~TRINITY_DN61449_c0_g1_i1.p2  ORF type:complete len:337 (+),score=121.22 TRINITY_DN61449_c0_g1_i1:90-1013(+)
MPASSRLAALSSHLRPSHAAASDCAAAGSPYLLPCAKAQLEKYGREEWELRCKLAMAYRIARHEGWDQHIFNHITVKVPGTESIKGGPHFLINPFGLRFDEVTASGLLKVDIDGNIVDPGLGQGPLLLQGFVVHSSVHMARPDLTAVWHCHHHDSVAVSMSKHGVLPLNQEALLFFPDKIAYHPFEGSTTDVSERKRMGQSLGPTKRVCILESHGPLTAGTSLEEAFAWMANLTRACTYQVRALSSVGGDLSKIRMPTDEEMRVMAQRLDDSNTPDRADTMERAAILMFRSVARLIEARDGAHNIYV